MLSYTNSYNALRAYNSYNKSVFWYNIFFNHVSLNDYIAEVINTAIDYSNMNFYNKEYYKALVSNFKKFFV